ncbi:MAG TPA: biotin--[acetyl-CoA-carboxylase] ligase [Candidatus Sulfotelmatobacter sp.]|nr:biotin--[acetyl-CoA-carboxylase] ligase [Candidatus Sulfotelmatobacter sp.]
MSGPHPFLSRLERFAEIDSTQRVVAGWLADGLPEVALATADVQTAGRGRAGRAWQAPAGTALLMTCGFRPRGLPLARAWRLAAIASLALAEAVEAQGLRDGAIGLKWPNDLVADGPHGEPLKMAGVLGEVTAAADGTVETCLVGLGVNVDWPVDLFPPDLAASMTSLRELARRPVDRDAVLEGFLDRLEPRHEALLAGRFDSAGWAGRQRTTGRHLTLQVGDEVVAGQGVGVDPLSGALRVDVAGTIRRFDSAEVLRCRIVAAGRG